MWPRIVTMKFIPSVKERWAAQAPEEQCLGKVPCSCSFYCSLDSNCKLPALLYNASYLDQPIRGGAAQVIAMNQVKPIPPSACVDENLKLPIGLQTTIYLSIASTTNDQSATSPGEDKSVTLCIRDEDLIVLYMLEISTGAHLPELPWNLRQRRQLCRNKNSHWPLNWWWWWTQRWPWLSQLQLDSPGCS